MPEITKTWVSTLTKRQLEAICALSAYHRTAVNLEIEVEKWMDLLERPDRTTAERAEIWQGWLLPYFRLWVSTIYVVDEGFQTLGVEDALLERARRAADPATMRRFRNATFHFRPQVRPRDIGELIERGGLTKPGRLHERHGVLIRRALRFARQNKFWDENFDAVSSTDAAGQHTTPAG